ncbi:MAG: ATP-binding protein [Candidatus Omnitrophica bacterium]|nr:ATP-binding protein [Candidatus Omnitrophota bacterium]
MEAFVPWKGKEIVMESGEGRLKAQVIIDESIPSRLHLVPVFIASAVGKLGDLQMGEDTVFDLKLCLHEAVVNAIRHGNKEKSELPVHVVIKTENNEMIMEVTDQGKGFDFSRIPDPTTKENIGKLHGRGVYLIQSAMDGVKFLNGGRTIKMVKALKTNT